MNMYHYPNHGIYHTSSYQSLCSFVEHSNPSVVDGIPNNQFHVLQNNVEPPPPAPAEIVSSTEPGTLTSVIERKSKVVSNKKSVDTSNFSIEERLVAAVWVHERKNTKSTISQIKHEFRQRFGRDPPAKNTLLVWERKLFSSGSVHDAPRPGRPVNRLGRAAEVHASMSRAPALSLRARALLLRLPRTTLRTILRHDLRHTAPDKDAKCLPATGKQPVMRNVKRQPRKTLESQVKQSTGACASIARHTQ